jgi:paraquat-inducible protein A
MVYYSMSDLRLPAHLGCHDCDALFATPALGEGERVVCPRCGASLFTRRWNSLHRTAALVVAALVLFIAANLFPFMSLRSDYRESQMVLSQSVSGLVSENYTSLAVAVAIFVLGAPALIIGGLLYLLLPLFHNRRWPGALRLCRWIYQTRRWNMIEVFLLGALVSLLKLGKLATLTLGTSFWALVGLIVCLAAALTSIDHRELWARLEAAQP